MNDVLNLIAFECGEHFDVEVIDVVAPSFQITVDRRGRGFVVNYHAGDLVWATYRPYIGDIKVFTVPESVDSIDALAEELRAWCTQWP